MDISNLINLILTMATVLMAIFVLWGYREQKKATYLQFYEIVAKHHSAELTSLRREVMKKLSDLAEQAKTEGKSLYELDPDFHLKTSTLANYYEGMGTFLKGGLSVFPKGPRKAMLEMLHGSVSTTWPLIDKYRTQIHPTQAPDWSDNFRWLYHAVAEFRRTNSLEPKRTH